MKVRIWRDLAILIVISAFVWIAFTFIDCGGQYSNQGLISIEREEKIGNEIAEYYLENDPTFTPADNQVQEKVIQLISQRLITSLDTIKYDYNIHLIENSQINAMTTPGGHIFVFSGLIEFCKSPEELAGVIAHEIAHAQKRHVVSRLIQEMGITAVISILSGGDPGVILQVSQLLLKSNFSRIQESEADEFACQLLQDAGIDHFYLASFFERLLAENKSYPEEMKMIMTHPHHSDRIKSIRSFPRSSDFQKHPFYGLEWNAVSENNMKKDDSENIIENSMESDTSSSPSN